MADPRNPLISGVTNDASDRGVNKLPTAYAVNQLFSGETLAANKNVDTVTECGNYRFIASTTGLPSHMNGTTGILTVLHDRPSITEGVFGGADPVKGSPVAIRQIAWPDGPNDVTPYTRTKTGNTWGEWVTMGGNLRRVKLTANTTAQTNVMYYSFGNYTLTLPNPSNYPLGTRIGLEQYSGTGKVVYGSYSQITEPAYQADNSGNPTSTVIGPNVYFFEIVEGTNNGTREWLLDVDNDLSKTIENIRTAISTETITRLNNDNDEAATRLARDNALEAEITAEASTRESADTTLQNNINSEATTRANADTTLEGKVNATLGVTIAKPYGNTTIQEQIINKERLSKVYIYSGSETTFEDGNGNPVSITNLLKVVNPTFIVKVTGKTITLPAAAEAYNGCHVNIEVPGSNHTIKVVAGDDNETFTNTTGATLLLPFECVMNASGTYIWNLLVIA